MHVYYLLIFSIYFLPSVSRRGRRADRPAVRETGSGKRFRPSLYATQKVSGSSQGMDIFLFVDYESCRSSVSFNLTVKLIVQSHGNDATAN